MASKKKAQRAEGLKDFAGTDAEQEALAKLASAAKKANGPGEGHNSEARAELIRRHVTIIRAQQMELDDKVKEVGSLRSVLQNYYKVAKKDGLSTDEIREYLKIKKLPQNEVVAAHQNMREILVAMDDDLHTVHNLFALGGVALGEAENPAAAQKRRLSEAVAQGQHAAQNKEPRSNNQYQQGTEEWFAWNNGHQMGEDEAGTLRTSEGAGQLA